MIRFGDSNAAPIRRDFSQNLIDGAFGTARASSHAMTPQELRDRTDRFADAIIAFCRHLPQDPLCQRMAQQLQDAGTSTAANSHAACRARSRAAFVAKLSIVVEEADESIYWLRRLEKAGLSDKGTTAPLLREANELVAIFVASQRTAANR